MSNDYQLQIQQLLEQAYGLDHGPAQVALLEEAIGLADSHGQAELGFEIRDLLIEAATFSGYPEKALVAFTWCLGQCDADPQSFNEEELLWKYKWVMESLPGFPQVSKKQIHDALDDMARRFERAGASPRPVHKISCDTAVRMGDRTEATKAQSRWESAPHNWLADCLACELNDQIRYLLFMGNDESALEQAEPIVKGRLRCGEVPHLTLSQLLLPLIRLGRAPEALPLHQRGYRLVSSNRKFVSSLADHLVFLTLIEHLSRAVKLFDKHFPWALESMYPWEHFRFFLAARFLMERLLENGKETLGLRLPRSFARFQETGKYEVAQLLPWFGEQLDSLARRFDDRNGNDHYSRTAADNRKLSELVCPMPVPTRRGQEEEAAE